MEYNPYQSPALDRRSVAEGAVRAPAMALLIVAIICIGLSVVCIAFDIYFLSSGFAAELGRRTNPPHKETTVIIRTIWTGMLLVASCFVAFGAWKMQRLESFSLAFSSAVVAAIPCVGPCCLLGIPFGIWAIVVLNRPDVRSAFRS